MDFGEPKWITNNRTGNIKTARIENDNPHQADQISRNGKSNQCLKALRMVGGRIGWPLF